MLALLLQDGLDALALVGAQGDGGFLRAQHLLHLALLVILLHGDLLDGVAQVAQLLGDSFIGLYISVTVFLSLRFSFEKQNFHLFLHYIFYFILKSRILLFIKFEGILFLFFLFKYFIYLFMRDTHTQREGETQAEGEAGSMQGAQCGT